MQRPAALHLALLGQPAQVLKVFFFGRPTLEPYVPFPYGITFSPSYPLDLYRL